MGRENQSEMGGYGKQQNNKHQNHVLQFSLSLFNTIYLNNCFL